MWMEGQIAGFWVADQNGSRLSAGSYIHFDVVRTVESATLYGAMKSRRWGILTD